MKGLVSSICPQKEEQKKKKNTDNVKENLLMISNRDFPMMYYCLLPEATDNVQNSYCGY